MFSAPLNHDDERPIQPGTLRRVVGIFRPYRAKVLVVSAAIIVTSILGIANPWLIKLIFDDALFGNPPGQCSGGACPNLPLLYKFVGLMIVIPIVTSLIGIGQT
jgi:ATP-binding cassette, subfamily B, bacterial